ncbi:MAG: hypothetical protein PHD81_04135 [Candidatus Nanoarchaeia archaeon]|nr:hypothetical protein [Candidatus Nanoarchaeia archaeon]MDD5588271.1 hypothetical protein [Candidatus Nanoarchaeia archaeon]
MKIIILDTSFLLDCIKFKIDFISEFERICNFNYKLAVIDQTLNELKDKKNSKLALKLVEKFEIIKTKKDNIVDNLILDTVDENYVVATEDQALKRRLKEKNIQTITIRQKHFLILV